MSNAMRSGKRTLAAVAAGALGVAVLPIIGASSASASATLSMTQTISRAGVVLDSAGTAPVASLGSAGRAATVTASPSAAVTLDDSTVAEVGVRVDSKPTGAGVTVGTVYESAKLDTIITAGTNVLATTNAVPVEIAAADDTATAAAFNVAGNYGITYFVDQNGDGVVQAGDVAAIGTLVVAGAPASFSFKDAAQTGPAAVSKNNQVILRDSANNITRLTGTETVPIVAAAGTGATGTLSLCGTGTVNCTVIDDSVTPATTADGVSYVIAAVTTSGATGAFTATASGAGMGLAGTAAYTFTVEAQTTTKNINVAAANLATSWAGPVTTSTTTTVRTDTTSLQYTVTADDTAVAGELVPLTFTTITNLTAVTVDGVAVTAGTTLYKAIDSSRQATFSVAVTGNASNSALVVTTGGAINAGLTVNWDDAAFTLVTSPASGTNIVLATGAAASIQATVADQFGNGYLGACVVSSNGTASATTTTPASGVVNVSIPAPASGTSASLTVNAFQQGCSTQIGSTSTVTATYGVAVITLTGVSTATVDETVAVPSQVTGSNNFRQVTANVKVDGSNVPNNTIVTFSGSDSVRFGGASTGTWAASVDETIVTTTSGNASIYMTSSKAGKATVTASAAGQSASGDVTGVAVAGTGRTVDISAPETSSSGDTVPVTVAVTDGFGNGISGVTVTVSIPNDSIGRFANGLRQNEVQTGTDGTAIIDAVTGINEDGVLTLRASATGAQFASAADVPAGTGFTAGQAQDAVAVEVAAGPGARTILIDDSGRDSKDNRRWIYANGTTTGFDEGDILKPWVKFPGGSYTEGNADIPVSGEGEFEWERKTNKKSYVIIKSEDGTIQSARVVIPARNA